MQFLQLISKFHKEESGQDLLEYGLVVVAVLTAVVAGTASLGTTIANALTSINATIQGLV
jgi:Flp pilus assembly pilin Flp